MPSENFRFIIRFAELAILMYSMCEMKYQQRLSGKPEQIFRCLINLASVVGDPALSLSLRGSFVSSIGMSLIEPKPEATSLARTNLSHLRKGYSAFIVYYTWYDTLEFSNYKAVSLTAMRRQKGLPSKRV